MYEKRGQIFSFGGGVQSHAVLILQSQGKLTNPYDAFIFANVGADSENPATLDYLERYTKPFAEEHNITLIEISKKGRTVREQAIRPDLRSVVIPAFKGKGGHTNRTCTTDWKIKQVDRAIRTLAYTHCVVGLGISLDESHRARNDEWHDRYTSKTGKTVIKLGFWRKREYPLLDLKLTRAACHAIIASAGLPPVPKSSCFFCPFRRPGEWITLKQTDPKLFQRAIELEAALNQKGIEGDPYYLHAYKKPLEQAVSDQLTFDELLSCDTGYCGT